MRFASDDRTSMTPSEKLRAADDMTPELMAEMLDVTCRRALLQSNASKALRLKQLIGARAWTDAALALIELELPLWHIRRVTYDAGEWYCALSRDRELPDWLDQSVQAHHQDLALAILAAFVEAQAVTTPLSQPSVPTVVPTVRHETSATCVAASCDNFA